MSVGGPDLFVAISSKIDHVNPYIFRLMARTKCQSAGWYFVRATQFCKNFELTGCLAEWWPDVARFSRWPKEWGNMGAVFRECGLVDKDKADELRDWDELNLKALQKRETERKNKAQKRRTKKRGLS